MTIRVRNPGDYGGISYDVFPPGIGFFDNPIVTLPMSVGGSLPVGALIYASVRDSSGNSTWSLGAGYPRASLTSAASAGDTSVQAKRSSYMYIPGEASSPNAIADVQGLDGATYIFPDGALTKVVKPTGQTWTIGYGTIIYGYISSGITLYTNSFGTAVINSAAWIAGYPSVTRASTDTDGYLSVPSFSPGQISTVNGISGTMSVRVATTGGIPQLRQPIYMSPDRTLVSLNQSTTTPINLGNCVGFDKTTSPSTFFYLPSNIGTTSGQTLQRVSESINILHKTFIQVSMGTTFSELIKQLQSASSNSSVFDNVSAPVLDIRCGLSEYIRVPDLCFDPILPAPFDNLRIIWTQDNSRASQMYPSLVSRTSASVPVTGMVATGRVRGNLEQYPWGGPGIAEFRYLSCDFAHGQIYQFGAIPKINGPSNSGTPAIRAGLIPSAVVQGSPGNCSTLLGKYGIWDQNASAYVVIPGYPAVAFTPDSSVPTSLWHGTMSSPAPTYIESDAIGQFTVMFSANGAAYTAGFCSYYQSSVQTGRPIYPFEIVRASTQSDAGGAWSGNTGWRFGALPMPALTWGAAPTATFSAGTGQVTLSAFTSVSYTIAAGHGVINAFSGTVSTAQLQLMGYRLDWIGLAADLQPAGRGNTYPTGGGVNCDVSILLPFVSFKPVTGSTTLRVIIYVQATPPHPYALGQINEYVIDIAVP